MLRCWHDFLPKRSPRCLLVGAVQYSLTKTLVEGGFTLSSQTLSWLFRECLVHILHYTMVSLHHHQRHDQHRPVVFPPLGARRPSGVQPLLPTVVILPFPEQLWSRWHCKQMRGNGGAQPVTGQRRDPSKRPATLCDFSYGAAALLATTNGRGTRSAFTRIGACTSARSRPRYR